MGALRWPRGLCGFCPVNRRGDGAQSGGWPWAKRPGMESHGHCPVTASSDNPSPTPTASADRPARWSLPETLPTVTGFSWKPSPMPRSGRPGVIGERAGGRPWSLVPRSGEWPVGSLPWSAQAHSGWPGEEGCDAAGGLGAGSSRALPGVRARPPRCPVGTPWPARAPPPARFSQLQREAAPWGMGVPRVQCAAPHPVPPGSACHGLLLEASE